MWPGVAGRQRAGRRQAAGRRLQRLGEVHVAGDVARRVGVGDVAGDQALALRAQLQRLALEIERVGQSVEHREPRGLRSARGSDGAPSSTWRHCPNGVRPNISANSAAFPGLFAPLRRRRRFYSGRHAVDRPARSARARRAAPPRVGLPGRLRPARRGASGQRRRRRRRRSPPASSTRSARSPSTRRRRRRRPASRSSSASSTRACTSRRASASSPTCRRTSASGARAASACAARKAGRPGTSTCRSSSRSGDARSSSPPARRPAACSPSADLDEAEVDLAEEFTPAFFDRKLVVGRTLAQALRPGQAVRQAHIKSRQWFAAGDTVKVVAVGDGLRARRRRPGADQRHRGPAGQGADRERPRRHRRARPASAAWS